MLIVYLALLFCIYWYLTKNVNHWKKKNVPFQQPLPIIGNMLNGVLMRVSFGEFFHEIYQKTTSPIFGLYLFHKPALLIKDLQIIKRVLISDFQYFYDRNAMNNKKDDPISAHMLFFLKNPEWKEIRSKISPVYSSAKIKAMSGLIGKAASDMVAYINKESKNGAVVDMKKVTMKFTVNVITSTAFGVEANSFEDDKAPFQEIANRMLNWEDFMISFRIRCYFLAHSLVKIFRMKLIDPFCSNFLETSFCKIMEQRITSKNKRNDLIDILLELKKSETQFLEDDILTSQAMVFFVAGFETSSSTITFALHELAFHPEIQEKMRNEVEEVSKKHGGITYEALQEMEFLDMVVHETLRKYPIIPVLDRQCNTQYTIPETGTVIEKDTPVFIPVISLHHDPKYFPDPEVFDPWRFSQENKHKIQGCTYIPFGEGPRNCIGARFGKVTVKMGLANIVKNFVLEPSETTREKIKFNPRAFVMSPLGGVNLRVIKTGN